MIAQETVVLTRPDYVADTFCAINSDPNKACVVEFSKVSFANVGAGYPAPNRKDNYTIFDIGGNFWDIIKDQIHIFPALDVDFGLVLSQKEIAYYVWNSWSTKSAEVFEPVASGDPGTTLVFDVAGNFTLGPGQGCPGALTVFIEGPISSSTSFYIKTILDGTTKIDYTINTRATRVIAAPFWADWSQKVEFGLDFKTVVFERKDAKEQRRPMMAKPRRTVTFTNNPALRGLVDNFLNFACDKSIGMPVIHEMFQVQFMDNDKKGVEIRENKATLWNLNNYCDYIILYDITKKMVVAKKIASKTATHIYFENPVLEEFTKDSMIVGFPMLIGYINSAKPTIITSEIVNWSVEMLEMVGDNQPELLNVPAVPADFPFEIDWSEVPTYERSMNRFISEFNGRAQNVYSRFPYNRNTPMSFGGKVTLSSREEMCNFLNFICACKGMLKSFNIVVPINGVNVVRGEYPGSTNLSIKNNFFAEQLSKMVNKNVVVKYHNNQLQTSIYSATNNGEYTNLTLSAAMSWQVYLEDCDKVQIFRKIPVRLDMDNFRFVCENGKVFTITVKVKELV